MVRASIAWHTERLDPFGPTPLQIVDFSAFRGPNFPPSGKLEFAISNDTGCAPIDFSAENRKSLRRLGRMSISSQKLEKSKPCFRLLI